MTPKKKKQAWAIFGFRSVCLISTSIVVGAVFLYAGWVAYQEAPKIIEVQEQSTQLHDPYVLSSAQEEVLLTNGYPEAFTILFFEEETIGGGTASVRLETWDYYTQGFGLTFINGENIAEDPIEVSDIKHLDSLPYNSEQFNAFMSLEEVIAAAGIDTYVEIPLEKDFLEGGVVYFADSLTFGLKDNQLVYVEALALTQTE